MSEIEEKSQNCEKKAELQDIRHNYERMCQLWEKSQNLNVKLAISWYEITILRRKDEIMRYKVDIARRRKTKNYDKAAISFYLFIFIQWQKTTTKLWDVNS